MKMFLWQYVNECSYNYHAGGGVVVFAHTEKEARNYANDYIQRPDDDYDWRYTPKGIQPDEKPDLVTEVRNYELRGKVFIFPDAGCC